jgi:ATP adenylyltransferase
LRAEDEGVEPTGHLRGQGLANLCLSRSAYPPSWLIIANLPHFTLLLLIPRPHNLPLAPTKQINIMVLPTMEKDCCLFCEEYKNPENVIFENKFFYARFDKFPISPGHTEIVPKKHIESFLALKPEEWVSLQDAIKETVHLIEMLDFRQIYTKFLENPINEKAASFYQKMLKHPGIDKKPDGYNFGINDGEAAGRTVHHLHVHIIPRFLGDVENPRGGIRHMIPGLGNY